MEHSPWARELTLAALALALLLATTASAKGDFTLGSFSYELKRDGQLLASANQEPLFVLLYSESPDIWQARAWRMVGPDEERVERDGSGYKLEVPSFEKLAVSLKAKASMDEAGNVSWRFNLENKSPGTVVGVIGPCLRNVQDRQEGCLYVPNRAGHIIHDPWTKLLDAVQHMEYPVPASMQYLAFCGKDGGVAVHCFDKTMVWKQLAFGGEGRQMSFIQYPFVAPGGEWDSPEVLWQVLDADWHSAADRYRQWFRGWARKPEVSPVVKAMPIVPGVVIKARPVEDAWLKDVTKAMEVGTYDGAYPKLEQYASSGMDGIHLIGWFGQGHDTSYPDHYYAQSMGGRKGLLALADRTRELRLLGFYYLNARLLNLTSVSYRTHPDWAAITPSGKPRTEQLGGEFFHVACPGAPGYQQHMADEVLRVARDYGGAGVQLDQIGAAWSVLCFDKTHGHKTPATAWAEGHMELLEGVYKGARIINPDFVCWVEGVWEGSSQWVDMSQGGFWPDHPGSEPFPQLYHYTLPEHPLFGDARLGGVPYWCPSDIGRARRINAVAGKLLLEGDFRDDIGLTVDGGGEGHWFRQGKQVVVAVYNPTGERASFNVTLKTTELGRSSLPKSAKALAEPDQQVTPAVVDGTLTFSVGVPGRQVEAVLLDW